MIKTVHTFVTNSAMLAVFEDLNFTQTAIKHPILTHLLRRFIFSTATTT
jgi:hypothetical protein